MKIPYSKIKSKSKNFDYFFRPMINVVLINGTKSRTQKGLIDSGADYTLLSSSIAKDLGINYKLGIHDVTLGIENRPLTTYYCELEIAIPGIDNSNFTSLVGFVESGSVGILLGQKGFFDKFNIKFSKQNNYFEIDPF